MVSPTFAVALTAVAAAALVVDAAEDGESAAAPCWGSGRFVRYAGGDTQASAPSSSRLRVTDASSGMPGPIVVDIVALEM